MNIAQSAELKEIATLSGEWNGEGFSFEVHRHYLTPKMMQRFADFKTRPLEISEGLAEIIVSWTIDYNGEEFLPTAENLSVLPVTFLTYLLERMNETFQGNEQTPSESANGSGASANSKTAKAK